ncbi:MAG: cation transporter [Lachnospiraceae bacterium]|nr:cation transporter [Lachnospiraceae bacterium]
MKKSRDAVIVRTSIIGIIANVFLAAFKAFVGLTSNSIAIVMDAVNNLSDAASSVITIVGTKLAGKEPDRKHPFGYGRIEYLSAMMISFLVLYAGITAFVESVKKIISPGTPDYSAASLIIVAVAVAVKILLGRYVKSVGKKVNSDSLVNSGEDATLDSVISASTLVAAALYLTLHISLEAWLGAVIALVIIKSGFEMLRETISHILGKRADQQLARDIKETVNSYPEISGAYDLVLHDYGPDSYNGSLHIEVPDTLSADELDTLIRRVTDSVYQKHDVILTAIGVYSVNTKDADVVEVRKNVLKIVKSNPYVLQMHGFHLDKEEKKIRFDIVVSFDAGERRQVQKEVYEKVLQAYPDYTLQIAVDMDFS